MSQIAVKPLPKPPKPLNNNGTIGVAFTYVLEDGVPYRYRFQLGGQFTDPIALKLAEEICHHIYLDTIGKRFDFTLLKYKGSIDRTILARQRDEQLHRSQQEVLDREQELIAAANKTKNTDSNVARLAKRALKDLEQLKKEQQSKEEKVNPLFLPLWDEWVKSLGLSERTREKHYDAIRIMAARAGNPRLQELSWFTDAPLKHTTFNQRRSYLVRFATWLLEFRSIDAKYNLKSRKADKFEEEEEPFSRNEMRSILEAFRNNTFCPKKSAFKHSYYADYVEFAMMTASRPQEIIGLRWKDVDFQNKLLTFSTVLARQDKGARIRKETKNKAKKTLPLKGRLLEMLQARKPENASNDDLVFPGTKGKPIDDTNFRDRQWIPVLEGLGIKYRRFYNIRHSVLTLVVKETGNLMEAAKLAGHKNLRMVQERYGHLVGETKTFNLDL